MFLLDTNVLSELRKASFRRADPRVVRWTEGVLLSSMFVSVITIHEIQNGVSRIAMRDPAQSEIFRRWLDTQVLVEFSERILNVDIEIARQSGRLNVPRTFPFEDLLLAATALVHNMTVVTRNVRDFKGTGVRVLNPFEDDPKEVVV